MKTLQILILNIFVLTCLTAMQLLVGNILVFNLFGSYLLLKEHRLISILWYVCLCGLIFDSLNFSHLGAFGITWILSWIPISLLRLFVIRALPNSESFIRAAGFAIYIYVFALFQHQLLYYFGTYTRGLSRLDFTLYLLASIIMASLLVRKIENKIAL